MSIFNKLKAPTPFLQNFIYSRNKTKTSCTNKKIIKNNKK